MTAASKGQAIIISIVIAVIFTITAVAGVWQATAGNHSQKVKAERVATQRHFWRSIAGKDSASSASVENSLAQDLSGLTSRQVDAFRGDSNRYGGITDALGMDPFDGTGLGCVECGPLSDSVRADLALIRQGRVDDVLRTVPQIPSSNGLTLTPFGVGFVTYLILLWVIVGSASYVIVMVVQQEKARVDARSILTFPSMAAWLAMKSYLSRKQSHDQISSVFPDAVRQIDEADKFLRSLPADSPTVKDLKVLRDQVNDELRRQAAMSAHGRDDTKLANLTASLTAVSDALQGRAAGFEAVDKVDHDTGL